MTNPINATSHCHQGQKLPRNWQQQAKQRAQEAESAYMQRLSNAWKGNASPASSQSVIQNARLRSDAADHYTPKQNHHPPKEKRCDGEIRLIERNDEWEVWQDTFTGAKIHRRVSWEDLFGRK